MSMCTVCVASAQGGLKSVLGPLGLESQPCEQHVNAGNHTQILCKSRECL